MGAANVRIQCLKGRYTQILADSLPLYGGQPPSIGLLQIPPADLGQVEIIKGAASALYGPSALGGVINLVSRRPASEPQGELLLNATSRNGQDVTGYVASPISETLSASVTAGYDRQSREDLNDDGWADMPGFERFTVRRRLFWDGADESKALLTLGVMAEQRDGGTMRGAASPDGAPFVQAQRSRRYVLGLTAETPLKGIGTFHLRASGVTQSHRHRFGDVIENDRHRTGLAEASSAVSLARPHGWRARPSRRMIIAQRPILTSTSVTVPSLFVKGSISWVTV